MVARLATTRSRGAGSAATRRTILAAAADLVANGGEDGLSIRELCARVEVTPPTIYHHFGDKKGLLHACEHSGRRVPRPPIIHRFNDRLIETSFCFRFGLGRRFIPAPHPPQKIAIARPWP